MANSYDGDSSLPAKVFAPSCRQPNLATTANLHRPLSRLGFHSGSPAKASSKEVVAGKENVEREVTLRGRVSRATAKIETEGRVKGGSEKVEGDKFSSVQPEAAHQDDAYSDFDDFGTTFSDDEKPAAIQNPSKKTTRITFAATSVPLPSPTSSVTTTVFSASPKTSSPLRAASVSSSTQEASGPADYTSSSNKMNSLYHGLSQRALNHQKLVWRNRYDVWANWQEDRHAYDGILAEFPSPPSHRSPSPPIASTSAIAETKPINPAIYPRSGDISALRDPYPGEMDKRFHEYQLWTIHRALYIFDMDHRYREIVDKESRPEEGESKSRPRSFGSDSGGEEDMTLVNSVQDAMDVYIHPGDAGPRDDEDGIWRPSDNGVRAWEVSWYVRWELFDELLRRSAPGDDEDEDGDVTMTTIRPSRSREDGRKSPMPKFFFEHGDDDEADDDEDEDDYGSLMSTSSFGLRSPSSPFHITQDDMQDDKHVLSSHWRSLATVAASQMA